MSEDAQVAALMDRWRSKAESELGRAPGRAAADRAEAEFRKAAAFRELRRAAEETSGGSGDSLRAQLVECLDEMDVRRRASTQCTARTVHLLSVHC